MSGHRKSQHNTLVFNESTPMALTSTRDNSVVEVLDEDLSVIGLMDDTDGDTDGNTMQEIVGPLNMSKYHCYLCQEGFRCLEELSEHERLNHANDKLVPENTNQTLFKEGGTEIKEVLTLLGPGGGGKNLPPQAHFCHYQ